MPTKKTRKIGVLVGREQAWANAFIEAVGKQGNGITAEALKLGGTRMEDPCEYNVIVDRMSQQVPYYRTFLKSALISGTKVINNPFWASAIDGFYGAAMATRLGIQHPRTVALPSHSYEHDVSEDSLGNLIYPIPWHEHISYLGEFPVVLRPVWNKGTGKVYKLDSYEDLWRAYNETGTECMMLQEFIGWEKYVRCTCIGQKSMVLPYDPYADHPHAYLEQPSYLSKEEERRVLASATRISQVLGYDVSAIDFALKGDNIYVTDMISPPPHFDPDILPAAAYTWVVDTLAEFVIALAKGEKQPLDDFKWESLANVTWTPLPADDPPIVVQATPEKKKPTKRATSAAASATSTASATASATSTTSTSSPRKKATTTTAASTASSSPPSSGRKKATGEDEQKKQAPTRRSSSTSSTSSRRKKRDEG